MTKSCKKPLRILVIALRLIGDALLLTPLIRSLRVAYPDAVIDVLVFQPAAVVLAGNPDINHLILMSQRPTVREYGLFLMRHARRYDWAMSAQSGDRPALCAWVAGRRSVTFVPEALRYAGWKRLLLSHTVPFMNEGWHAVRQGLRLAEVLGIPKHYAVVLPLVPSDVSLECLLGFDPVQPYVVCHITPSKPYKAWPDSEWRALIQRLMSTGYRVVMSCSARPQEQQAVAMMLGSLQAQVVPCYGRSFSELAAVIRAAKAYVGVDTSVTHVAAATGVKTIALLGPTDPIRWGPWPANWAQDQNPWQARGPVQRQGNVLLLQDSAACVPCQQEGCDRRPDSVRNDCLRRMTVEWVWAEVQSVL